MLWYYYWVNIASPYLYGQAGGFLEITKGYSTAKGVAKWVRN